MRSGRRTSSKQQANLFIMPIARSVAPNSNAPASEVTGPASNAATTLRPSTGANSKRSALQSVGIGVLRESEINCCYTTIFADSQPRCTQFGERSALSAVSSSIPDVLWYVVIIGSLVTIVFIWMVHMDLIPQIVLGGTTAFFLGLTTFLIYAMDHPLQGGVGVGPEPFQDVYNSAMKWDEGFGGETMASLGTGEVDLVYYSVGRAICNIVNRDIGGSGV